MSETNGCSWVRVFDELMFDERVFVGTNVPGNKCSTTNVCSTRALPLHGRAGYIYYRLSRCVVLLVGWLCRGGGSEAPREGR